LISFSTTLIIFKKLDTGRDFQSEKQISLHRALLKLRFLSSLVPFICIHDFSANYAINRTYEEISNHVFLV